MYQMRTAILAVILAILFQSSFALGEDSSPQQIEESLPSLQKVNSSSNVFSETPASWDGGLRAPTNPEPTPTPRSYDSTTQELDNQK